MKRTIKWALYDGQEFMALAPSRKYADTYKRHMPHVTIRRVVVLS